MARSWWLAAFVGSSLAVLPATASAACEQTGSFVPSGAIQWQVDHADRRISVRVNLAFYRADCPASYTCALVDAATITRITQAIQRYWSGQKYRCYELMVVVNAASVANQSEVCEEALDVALDYAPANPRNAHVAANGARPSTEAWGSDSPADRLDPMHSTDNPTRWKAFARPGDYAHEFGHILGLHDNYDARDPKAGPLPGYPENLMTRAQGYVTQEMIDRVIKRSGNVNDDDVLCAWDVSSTGQLVARNFSVETETLDSMSVDIEGMRLIEAADGSVGGFGTMKLQGTETSASPEGTCANPFSHETLVHASGTHVSSGTEALLRIHLDPVPELPSSVFTCTNGPVFDSQPNLWGLTYGLLLREFDLPAAGGVATHTRSEPTLPNGTIDISSTFTVVPVKE